MSYAIIRNAKYKRENLKGIFRHNERRNKNYSNKNIDKEKSYLNYSLKDTQFTYEKEFDRIRKEYNLKGQIKTVSNIICEYIITSDKTFFDTIGEDETPIYESDYIEPGKAIREFQVNKALDAGDYMIYMNISTYSMDGKNTRLNGASVKADLHVVN